MNKKLEIGKFKIIVAGIIIIFLVGIFAVCFYNKQQDHTVGQVVKGNWTKLRGMENIGNDYFINASEWHYNQESERQAACAVENYSKQAGIKNEEWELTHLYREEGIVSAFVRSINYRELFLLLEQDKWLLIADIQSGDNLETDLMDGAWSYHSDLNWNSFEAWFFDREESNYKVKSDYKYYQYDSIYMFPAECAMQAYLTKIDANKSIEWEIMYERFFIASSGCLVDVWYTDGENEVHMVLDINNKLYTVIDIL